MTPAKPAPTLPEKLKTDPQFPRDIRTGTGRLVAAVDELEDRAEACALAAEIVKRYNEHAALLAFVEEVFPLIENVCSGHQIAQARALIATVRGRP